MSHYTSLVDRLRNNTLYKNQDLIDQFGGKSSNKQLGVINIMQLVTLVALTEIKQSMTVKELRNEMVKLLPNYFQFNFNNRTTHNLYHYALRKLKQAGFIEMNKKLGSNRIHAYRISDKFMKIE